MRIALITGANPKTFQKGAIIRLRTGFWRIRTEGMWNSRLALRALPSEDVVEVKDDLVVAGGVEVQLSFIFRGNEPYISVFATYEPDTREVAAQGS